MQTPRHAGPDADPAHLGSELAETDFDDLLREVLLRVHGVLDDRARWRLLLDAVVTMAADLSLDHLLKRIVEIASDLAGARYAALGVLGVGSDRRLQTFVTHGVTPAQHRAIGDLPTGHGLLGLIIDQPAPLRLHDIAEHPESYGFPPDHPPMRSFLGVPVRIREKVFGNLYLTEKVGDGDFTEQDEAIVVALAAAAGVAIENARLHEEAARRERWLEATAEIIARLAGPGGHDDALQVIADHARELAASDVAWIVAGPDIDGLRLRVVSGEPADAERMDGVDLSSSLTSSVVRTGTPAAVEDISADPSAVNVPRALGWPRIGPAIIVPLRGAAGVEGVLALGWKPERLAGFHAVDPSLPASFAEQAALALEVTRAREDRQRLLLFEDRDRIGRDLHDLVIQRLFALGLSLQSTARSENRPELTEKLDSAVDDLDATIRDIRRTIFALGSAENASDIQAEVTRMVDRAAGTLKFRPALRFEGPVRTRVGTDVAPDVLAVLTEALSNAARHAHARAVSVELTATDGIRLTVTDNGQGMSDDVPQSGLSNMRQRAERRGGHCAITSRPGEGTTIEWWVPA